jgi:hypothetical protein
MVFFVLDTVPKLDLSRFYTPRRMYIRRMSTALWCFATDRFSGFRDSQECHRNGN